MNHYEGAGCTIYLLTVAATIFAAIALAGWRAL